MTSRTMLIHIINRFERAKQSQGSRRVRAFKRYQIAERPVPDLRVLCAEVEMGAIGADDADMARQECALMRSARDEAANYRDAAREPRYGARKSTLNIR